MRKTQFITAAVLLTLSMCIISCGSKTSESQTEKSATEQTENVKYQCPMKCEGEKTYDKPDSCPVCNMDLKKVEESHEHNDHDTSEHHNH
jgi:hypothetical protein